MSTKVFSTRLDPIIIEEIKTLSKNKNQNLQMVVEELLKNSLQSNSKKVDPWLEFVLNNQADISKELIDKKAKNQKLRQGKKQQILTNV